MRVALISTCAVSVPPRAYGGTELIISELAQGLTQLGHEVTTFATGDSCPAGRLQWHFERPVWPPYETAELRHAAKAWQTITANAGAFDIVHAHQAPSIPLASLTRAVPTVYTLHHHRDERLIALYRDFPTISYVAISARQAELTPEVPVDAVIHHGLDAKRYGSAGLGDGGYVAFLGRLAPEKAPHLAIDAARQANVLLRMGGGVHPPDRDYFAADVEPRLSDGQGGVEWMGELSHEPKVSLLRGARALLFPIEWEEPFGLVMVESMLVGTPVIAFAHGSAPEVIEEGVTGYIVQDVAAMADRIRQLDGFDRVRCRQRAIERWTSLRMSREYEALYERLQERSGRGWLRAELQGLSRISDGRPPKSVAQPG
ncbi:MAG: glycosyltransferase family 4 protein [Polyangiaceae bacterium]|jgi:glycosyltransferase involved in cell wall biosynthesis